MQITKLTEFCEQSAALLDLCVSDGERELKEYLQNPSVCVYTVNDGKIIAGVICVMVTSDSIDLLDIAVHPDFQGKGYGRALVEKIYELYNKEVFLEVRASNHSAIGFYETLGFEQISIRKKYYTAPLEDALIYRRKV